MYKILIVDDEESIRDLLKMFLEKENYLTALANDGKTAIAMFKSFKPDAVLLDIMLPDINGHEVLKEFNKQAKTPVLMLTAKNDIIDKVLGLELGADDYITKPFDGRELLARIKAVLRRLYLSEEINYQEKFTYLNLEIDFISKSVRKSAQKISLTPSEFKLITLLAQNPQKVFAREELLLKVWGYDFMGDSRAVDICITRLRKKLENDPTKPQFIMTVYGFGYRFGGD